MYTSGIRLLLVCAAMVLGLESWAETRAEADHDLNAAKRSTLPHTQLRAGDTVVKVTGPRPSDLFHDDQRESFQVRDGDGKIPAVELYGDSPTVARSITGGAIEKETNPEVKARMKVQDVVRLEFQGIELHPVALDPKHPERLDGLEIYLVNQNAKVKLTSVRGGKATPVRISRADFLSGKRMEIKTSTETKGSSWGVPNEFTGELKLSFRLGDDHRSLEDLAIGGKMLVKVGVSSFAKEYPSENNLKGLQANLGPLPNRPESKVKLD